MIKSLQLVETQALRRSACIQKLARRNDCLFEIRVHVFAFQVLNLFSKVIDFSKIRKDRLKGVQIALKGCILEECRAKTCRIYHDAFSSLSLPKLEGLAATDPIIWRTPNPNTASVAFIPNLDTLYLDWIERTVIMPELDRMMDGFSKPRKEQAIKYCKIIMKACRS